MKVLFIYVLCWMCICLWTGINTPGKMTKFINKPFYTSTIRLSTLLTIYIGFRFRLVNNYIQRNNYLPSD